MTDEKKEEEENHPICYIDFVMSFTYERNVHFFRNG